MLCDNQYLVTSSKAYYKFYLARTTYFDIGKYYNSRFDHLITSVKHHVLLTVYVSIPTIRIGCYMYNFR